MNAGLPELFFFSRVNKVDTSNSKKIMKKPIDIKTLLIGVLLGAIAVLGVAAAINHPVVCEYKLITAGQRANSSTISIQMLNEAAKEGWEAVGVTMSVDFTPVYLVKRLPR